MKTRDLCLFFFTSLLIQTGCLSVKTPVSVFDKIIKTPRVYIETLKHPTEFPEEFLPEVLDIDEMLKQNPLENDEIVKILLLSEGKLSSTHFVQVRKDSEIKPHFHKEHDKTISVKKGKGIAILNGTRYLVKPGMVLQIPSNTEYRFINTGDGVFVALSVFTPSFDGSDITYVKEKIIDKPNSEAQKEKKKKQKRKNNNLIVKEEGANKKVEKYNKEKEIQNKNNKTITKIHDVNEQLNNQNIKHDPFDSSLHHSLGDAKPLENPASYKNTSDELFTSVNDQDNEYDFALDEKIRVNEPLNGNADNKGFQRETEEFTFEEFDETEPNEFVYSDEEDLAGNTKQENIRDVFKYADDDPFIDTNESFIMEDVDEL
ncbi:MAG: cupin domain-containing protein [Candidatus Anammoxibacter sp.]